MLAEKIQHLLGGSPKTWDAQEQELNGTNHCPKRSQHHEQRDHRVS
jgi:hypothetical protein